MAEYKGAAKEGARAMALMKRREKMKADIEAAKNKISEVIIVSFALGKFTSWPADRGIINLQKKTRGKLLWLLVFIVETQDRRHQQQVFYSLWCGRAAAKIKHYRYVKIISVPDLFGPVQACGWRVIKQLDWELQIFHTESSTNELILAKNYECSSRLKFHC